MRTNGYNFKLHKVYCSRNCFTVFKIFYDAKMSILLSFMVIENTVHFIFDFLFDFMPTLLWIHSYMFVGCTKH